MATYQFSALADGQTISFNPNVDVLNFDRSLISAADISVTAEGANLRLTVMDGAWAGSDVLLQNVVAQQLATSNITFEDGSRLLLGDNTPGTANDNAANSLVGSAGRDQLAGFGGADTLNGGEGADTYFVSSGDVLVDSGGHDHVFSDVSWTLTDGLEDLTLTGTANLSASGNNLSNSLFGNAGNNYFNGRGGTDIINGAAGNDTIDMSTGGTGLQGNDTVFGGDGIDTVDYDGYAQSAVIASLDASGGSVTGGGTGGEGAATLFSVERFIGAAFNDSIHGGAGGQYLDGRGGDDTLGGGAGNDTLIGGVGANTFIFDVAPGAPNADQVTGFVSNNDRLVLDGLVHESSGPSGAFSAGDQRFWASATGTAHDASDRVIYNTSNGQLWYDADGNGSGAAQQIATLQGAPVLAATDVSVINGGSMGQHIVGTSGDDSLVGGDGDDTVEGLAGDDYLEGRGGHDSVSGGDGNDTLWGADPSNFHLYDWEVTDTLDGGFGDDVYHVRGDGAERVDTVMPDPGGIDTIHAYDASHYTLAAGFENLIYHPFHNGSFFGTGNELDNRIDGGAADYSELRGMGGNDTLVAGVDGGSLLDGGDGNDVLQGSLDHGNLLDGGNGIDTMTGGKWDDVYYATAGDVVTEAADNGIDTVNAHASWALGNNFENLTLLAGAVTANGNNLDNILTGNDANNTSINGRAGNDTMFGMGGNDVFDMSTGGTSSYGNDVIDGGAGTDSFEFGNNARSAVNIDLTAGTASGGGDGGAGSASLTSIENALGGNFNDTITGSSGANLLRGFGGNDTLNGKAGADQLNGGAGNDSFVFDAIGSANADAVQDFATGVDKLQMDDAVMAAIGATGNFAAGDARFWSSTAGTAHDGNDRVIYDSDGGQLWYDADGNGAGAAQLIATISGHPTLAATDIAVI